MKSLRDLDLFAKNPVLNKKFSNLTGLRPPKGLHTTNINGNLLSKNFNSSPATFNLLFNYCNELISIVDNLETQLQKASDVAIAGKTAVSGLAHDLRNPLTVISSCAQFCLETRKIPLIIKENVVMIQENVRKATNLLVQFLNFANWEFSSINLNDVIQRICETTISKNKGKKIILKKDLGKELPVICGNLEKIERVFTNLIINAIQAVSEKPKDRTLTIKSKYIQSKKMIEISINDNGPGIAANIKSKIFTPYFSTKKEGVGLGLHISKHFIEEHKGKIIVNSNSGKGTNVLVKLPILQK